MFELANVLIIESCDKNSGGPSEWKKNTAKCLFAFFQAQMKTWSIPTRYTEEGEGLPAFPYILTLY